METQTNPESSKQGSNQVQAIPEQYRGAVPYIYVNMAEAALEFYQKAFGAKVLVSIKDDKGKIAHSEIEIGKARLMISDEYPDMDVYSPRHLGGTTCGFSLFFEDADKVFAQAIAAGAKEIRKVDNQFCGDREGKLEDPFGHQWFIATHKEDVPYDEMKKRAEKLFTTH